MQEIRGKDNCSACEKGKYTAEDNQAGCQLCDVGKYANSTQQTECSDCEAGFFQNSKGQSSCKSCLAGQYSAEKSSSICVECDAGKYANSTQQTKCSDCEAGFFQNIKGQSSCKSCLAGQYSAEKSSSICVECDAGMYSLLNTTVCAKCPIGLYEKEKGSAMCRKCKNGKVPTIQQTECEKPRWTVVNDCLDYTQYFNSTDPDYTLWSCVDCPIGANCFDEINRKVLNWYDVRAKQGYWRVPWSTVNWSKVPVVFVKCPYFKDCVGWSVDSGIANATESCLLGTKGPLCSKCVEGYTRDTVRCTRCSNESFGIRVGIVIVSLILISIIIKECRKKRKVCNCHKWIKFYKSLLQIASISITFTQINSSMTGVIDVDWPIEWQNFLKRFNFVNIDVAQILGVSCIGDFDFFVNFLGMCCLPVTITLLGLFNFIWTKAFLKQQLKNLNKNERKVKEEETYEMLFELTDSDHSGKIDPLEILSICKQFGWRLEIETMIDILEKMGLKRDSMGILVIDKSYFLQIMKNHTLKQALKNHASAKCSNNSSTITMTTSHIVKYIAELQNYANSLSSATQLLLLAHTPVSTKVFRYFQCTNLFGRSLLVADYEIDCDSDAYRNFMPVVLTVMVLFTIGLPLLLSLYLFSHYKRLYTPKVFQKMGWLYDPYNKYAEWWQIHDVLMKMTLTGLLIYVPTTESRSAIATLLCIVTMCNLNYFKPHKNKVLFWFTQLCFATTSSKYIMSLLLMTNKNTNGNNSTEKLIIGRIMIGLDIFVMVGGVVAAMCSFWFLRNNFRKLVHNKKRNPNRKNDILDMRQIQVTPNLKLKRRRSSLNNFVAAAVTHDMVVNVQKTASTLKKAHLQKIHKRRNTASIRLEKRLKKRVLDRTKKKIDTKKSAVFPLDVDQLKAEKTTKTKAKMVAAILNAEIVTIDSSSDEELFPSTDEQKKDNPVESKNEPVEKKKEKLVKSNKPVKNKSVKNKPAKNDKAVEQNHAKPVESKDTPVKNKEKPAKSKDRRNTENVTIDSSSDEKLFPSIDEQKKDTPVESKNKLVEKNKEKLVKSNKPVKNKIEVEKNKSKPMQNKDKDRPVKNKEESVKSRGKSKDKSVNNPKNKNKKILKTILKKLGKAKKEQLLNIFSAADRDKSGGINREELKYLIYGLHKRANETIVDTFWNGCLTGTTCTTDQIIFDNFFSFIVLHTQTSI